MTQPPDNTETQTRYALMGWGRAGLAIIDIAVLSCGSYISARCLELCSIKYNKADIERRINTTYPEKD